MYLYEAKHRPIALFFKTFGRNSYKYDVTKQIVLSHYVFSDCVPRPDHFRWAVFFSSLMLKFWLQFDPCDDWRLVSLQGDWRCRRDQMARRRSWCDEAQVEGLDEVWIKRPDWQYTEFDLIDRNSPSTDRIVNWPNWSNSRQNCHIKHAYSHIYHKQVCAISFCYEYTFHIGFFPNSA